MVQLELGLENIRNYRRLAYTPWHALAEFVDNSTQSFFDNREELQDAYVREGSRLEVRITLDRQNDCIRIYDNAMGMDIDELARAARLGHPPPSTGGRSSYGLGMKTAACWFGNRANIRTTKLGSRFEHTIEIDVERIANGDPDLSHTQREMEDTDSHYTLIEMSELHKMPRGRTLGKIKSFLRSMYRRDLDRGTLTLLWQGEELKWDQQYNFVKAHSGEDYRKEFAFYIGEKRVSGWIGVLSQGGRPMAGFSVLRADRVIMGSPESWRPESVFGQIAGTNDLVNQRLVGEIYFDTAFDVAHTKDAILWADDEEEEVQNRLAEICSDYRRVALEHRSSHSTPSHTAQDIDLAMDQLRGELESEEMIDHLLLEEIPTPEEVEAAFREPLRLVSDDSPRFTAVVGRGDESVEIVFFNSTTGSPNDPYVVMDAPADRQLQVVVNGNHPFLEEIGVDGLLAYYRQCVYDVLAEWKARRRQQSVRPETIRLLKDRYLRMPLEIRIREADESLGDN